MCLVPSQLVAKPSPVRRQTLASRRSLWDALELVAQAAPVACYNTMDGWLNLSGHCSAHYGDPPAVDLADAQTFQGCCSARVYCEVHLNLLRLLFLSPRAVHRYPNTHGLTAAHSKEKRQARSESDKIFP